MFGMFSSRKTPFTTSRSLLSGAPYVKFLVAGRSAALGVVRCLRLLGVFAL